MTTTQFMFDLGQDLPVELQKPGRSGLLVGELASHPAVPVAATRTTTEPILTIDIGGRARPKGSMRHIGHGRMKEQIKDSPVWRKTVATEVHEEISECPEPTICIRSKAGGGCTRLHDGFPTLVGAEVEIELRFPPLKTLPKWLQLLTLLATSRATGDIDKHCRNILDALVDAGALKDDSHVIRLIASKRYCADDEFPGALILVRAIGAIDRGRVVAAC